MYFFVVNFVYTVYLHSSFLLLILKFIIMNEKTKMKAIYRYVQELGLSPKAVAEYLSKRENVSVTQYETPYKVLPGMYVYADGLIYPEIIEGRLVKAVVGYVEDKTVYAVCLREEKLPWSGDYLEVKATREITDGQQATCKILEAARQTGKKAEAAQWCHDYAEDGVKSGDAFLPSIDELEKLFANKTAINASLKALGVAMLKAWYWSSSEYGNYTAWLFGMGGGYRYWDSKDYGNYYVRPVLALEI